MELNSRKDIVWQIGKPVGKTRFAIGFANGFVCLQHQIRLIEPFVAVPLHCGPGAILCRGSWPYARMFAVGDYILRPCSIEPWMELDAADLIRVHDLLSELRISVATGGYRRDFSL